jgi:hypothetical protein
MNPEFISEKNQKLLWSTIQKIPQLHSTIIDTEQPTWFREHIRDLYENILNNNVSNMNKLAIRNMIKSLKSVFETDNTNTNANTNANTNTNTNALFTTVEDTAIENIGELIQKQQKQRNHDLSIHGTSLEETTLNDDIVNNEPIILNTKNMSRKTVSWQDQTNVQDRLSKLEFLFKNQCSCINVMEDNIKSLMVVHDLFFVSETINDICKKVEFNFLTSKN